MTYDPTLEAMRLRHLHTQPDEGYSEEIHSQAGSDLGDVQDRSLAAAAKTTLRSLETLASEEKIDLLRLVTSSLADRDQLALIKDILFGLPTWAKQEVSSHLDSLMFFDPVQYFPYEIVQTIFTYLSPRDLLNASAVNHSWRLHTQDEELWRVCFKREGWVVDTARLKAVEHAAREKSMRHSGPVDAVMEQSLSRRDSRKRRRTEAFNEPESMHTDLDDHDEHMEGTDSANVARPALLSSPGVSSISPISSPQVKGRRRFSTHSSYSMQSTSSRLDLGFRLKPTLMQADPPANEGPRVSWAYLYKQRRMLERNWENGTYQQFRLPHPKYEYEGHAECVYTIQHIGTTLVSGSRDRTIRRWDLETCRLKGQPLRGHAASVLCLQFDPSPENDLIVSGGSDSWVIVWRYSTGEIIKKMTTAHTESVLNLRFDDRYIVTCSKDKTIKIWSRRAMAATDPVLPAHVVPQDPENAPLIQEYTLLTQLLGHHAAVNAVMIHADYIVSASGDRHIKAWNIPSGRCERTYTGHTKGIACVQYDGRRIISGSSDNTVRIFDAEQQAEVACLHGHSNLVRTVQARFGDLEVASAEDLHEEAKRADMKWARAMAMGASPASGSRRSLRNAGSTRPEDMLTIGAKVPPGGGGTKWARIVSGSYDETVIIWRKDHDGKWLAKHKLHQDMLLRSRWRPSRQGPPPPPPPGPSTGPLTQQNLQQHTSVQTSNEPQQPARQSSQAATAGASTTPGQVTTTHTTTTTSQNQEPQIHHQLHHHHHHHFHHHHASGSNNLTSAAATASPSTVTATASAPVTASTSIMQAQQALLQQQQAQQRFAALTGDTTGLQHHLHSEHTHSARLDSNRIFKLQFDVRRIVCCSQNKVIIGWDFAAGNEELGKVGNWCEETY